MSYSNSELAHLWAQQNRESANSSTGNFSFRGRSLYSYNTEIARFIEGRVVYTTHHYSPTTSGKHQSQIWRSTSHLKSYPVCCQMDDIPDSWRTAAPIVLHGHLERIKSEIERILRARKPHLHSLEYQLEQVTDFLSDESAYVKRFKANKETEISLKELAILTTSKDLLSTLEELYRVDLKKKIAKEREENQKRREERQKREEKNISDWLAGKYHGRITGPVKLRIREHQIETSLGARITLLEAQALWACLLRGEDITNRPLGNYTVTKVTGTHLIVGCHTIPIEELDRMATLLNLTPRKAA